MAAQEENRGRGRNRVKYLGIPRSGKFHALHQHEFILIMEKSGTKANWVLDDVEQNTDESKEVTVTVDPKYLSVYDEATDA